MFKRLFDAYFTFNQQQRRGLFVLACICLLLSVVRLVYPLFIKPDPITIRQLPVFPIEDEIDQTTNKETNLSSPKTGRNHVLDTITAPQIDLFRFDPNLVNEQQLMRLGFKKKTAKALINFRLKGFVFKNKTDLKKVYGITNTFYQQIEKYIDLPLGTDMQVSQSFQRREKKTIDLNSADSSLLMAAGLFDVGTATRILRYRSRLGGFVHIKQIEEVFGFDPNQMAEVRPYLKVNARDIKKLNPNKAGVEELKKHPYIGSLMANKILEARSKKVLQWTEIKNFLNAPGQAEKLRPYLTFE